MIRAENFKPLGADETTMMCRAWAGSQGVTLLREPETDRTVRARCGCCGRQIDFVYSTIALARDARGKPKICRSCRE